jgi:hypothetical protein
VVAIAAARREAAVEDPEEASCTRPNRLGGEAATMSWTRSAGG